jgi:acetyl esterase/lipase
VLAFARADDLRGFPPLRVITGTRDYFYSDGPNLALRACLAGVDAAALNVYGAYHDFIEYSEGCGGGAKVDEALAAYQSIAEFAAKVV